jgi:uncharacterized protein (TIGR00255 family)
VNSMTGFGRGHVDADGVRVTATVQGWNHRNADIVFRLPEELRGLESRLRPRVAERVARGRCEVSIRIETSERQGGWRLDLAGLEEIRRQTETLVAEGRLQGAVALGDLLRSPLVVVGRSKETEIGEELVAQALGVALDEFAATRAAEGARLAAALRSGAAGLGTLVGELAARRAVVATKLGADLTERLERLLPGAAHAVPPERLAQEIALLVERSDVEEELERLRGHLVAFDDAIRAPGANGRRLDFLAQEIQRELSTLGAKARDLELTRRVVDAKLINEQLREQIQNVE